MPGTRTSRRPRQARARGGINKFTRAIRCGQLPRGRGPLSSRRGTVIITSYGGVDRLRCTVINAHAARHNNSNNNNIIIRPKHVLSRRVA